MLARFNDILPNGADRVVAMVESQLQHRQGLESAVVNGNLSAQSRSQIFAFLLGVLAIGGGIGLIAFDKPTSGLTAIIAAFVALAGTFIYGRYEQKQERERKRQELKEAAEAAKNAPKLPFD